MTTVKKNKTLLFLTYQYPFLPGEYFIESEIGHLSKAFAQVFVVPGRCIWWRSQKPSRQLPENVFLVDPWELPWIRLIYFSVVGAFEAIPSVLWGRRIWPGGSVSKVGFIYELKEMYKACVTKHMLRYILRTRFKESEVIAYSYWRNFSAAALAFLKKRNEVSRLFVRCHGGDVYHPKRWSTQSFIDVHADAVFPCSENGVKHLVEVKGLDARKIRVQRLGIKIPDSLTRRSTDGVLRLVSCSNIIPGKRVDLIARVVAAIPGRVQWTHIGDGPAQASVEEVVDSFDAAHEADLAGRLSNEAVYSYYLNHEVDWFINLSESEGVPVSIMEAMAHGIPCVATNVGGTSEIVNQDNGILISAAKPAEEIVSLIAEKGQRQAHERLSINARQTAESICSADLNYQKFCEVISQ